MVNLKANAPRKQAIRLRHRRLAEMTHVLVAAVKNISNVAENKRK
jgi:hypothetical protein